ncbi:MAG TPA: ABC transporter substrate-binding protein [Ruminococcus sp.]
MKFKITAVILSACFLLNAAGCNNKAKEKTTVSKGRYVEEEINFYDYSGDVGELYLLDGKISFLDRHANKIYTLNDGKTVFNASPISSDDMLGEKTLIMGSTVSPDGTIFLQYSVFEEDGRTYGKEMCYALISKDGQFQEITFDNTDRLTSFVYGNDGVLYGIGYDGILYELNISSKKFVKLCDFGSGNMEYKLDRAGDHIIVAAPGEILFYDCKNRTAVDTPQAIADFWDSNIAANSAFDFCDGEENSFYIACESGLFRYVMDGALVEQLIDEYSCRLGDPSYSVKSVICDGDSFIISCDEGRFFRYYYDPEAINEITSTLKIYSLEKSDTLSQIISQYKIKYPTVRVEHEIGMHSGMTYEDVVKNLTTSILSGNTPDIIMLDGLDIDNLEENNMLLDLSKCEDKWNPNNTLLDDIAKWNDENGLYSVACRFRIPAVGAKSDELETIKSLNDYADKVEEYRKKYNDPYPITYFESPESTIKCGLLYEGSEIISNGRVDKDKLEGMFDSCSRIWKNCQYEDEKISYSMSSQSDVEDEYIFATRLTCVLTDEHTLAIGTINTFEMDLNLATSIDTTSVPCDTEVKYGIRDNDRTFIPSCNLGIVESGHNNDDAVNFIAEAFDAENQKIHHNDGFPVNTDTLKWFYNKNKNSDNNFYAFGSTSFDKTNNIDMNVEWMTDKEVEEFESYIRNLNTPVIMDTVTKNIIIDAGAKCISGSMSPSEAADEVVRQLELKMKE